MKYSPHPDADKRAAQMVWKGRARSVVDAVREPLTARHVLVGASAEVISESAAGGVLGKPSTEEAIKPSR